MMAILTNTGTTRAVSCPLVRRVVTVPTMRISFRWVVPGILAGLAVATPAISQSSAPQSVRSTYQALNAVRVDAEKVFYVRGLELRRDAVRIFLAEGKLAFLTAVEGRVTGAVFTGEGQALAVPRDAVERHSLGRFLGEPILDQPFSRAYFRFTDDSGDVLTRQLSGVPNVQDAAFVEEWNPLVANLNSWHSIRILSDWLAADARPYFYGGLVGERAGTFDLLVDHRRPEQILIGQPQWVNDLRHYNLWASFPLESAAAPAGDHTPFTPVSFEIQTVIQPDFILEGRTRLRLRAAVGGERMVPLELSRYLAVQSVTLEGGGSLDFFQNEEISRNEVSQRGNDSLFVVLDSAPAAGEEVTLELSYRGKVISDAGNGVMFVGERGSWYPHVGGADRFAAFELTFRWPRRLRLVATGELVEERADGEWKTGRWRAPQPFSVVGFNLGEYDSEQVAAGATKVEIFANRQLEEVLMRRFSSPATLPVQPRQPIMTARGPVPPMPRVLLPDAPAPSPAALLKRLGGDLSEAVQFYEKLNGPFPFQTLRVAQIPGAFGQGWPGLLYLSTFSFLSPEAQRRAGVGKRTQEQFTELVPFHEVVHQWWGGIVGWSSYRDQWIHEGLAQYLTLLFAEHKRPQDNELAGWLQTFREELAEENPQTEATVESAGPLALGYRLRSSKSPGAYAQIAYGKGAWVFHMLRMMLRDPAPQAKDADARFAEVLQALLEKCKFRSVTALDLQREFEKRMTPAMDLEGDRTLDWFFDQWVRSTGIPRYKATFEVKAQGATAAKGAATSYLVRGKLTQSEVPPTFLAAVPLYAARAGGKPVLLGNVVTSGEETSFQFTTRFAPRRILIDPHSTLLTLPN